MTRTSRPLTDAERRSLSPGLLAALDAAGAEPFIVPRAHPVAILSALWRGHVPILTLGLTIHWPGAAPDLTHTPAALPILQHELQHVLEFATGELTAAGYLLNPRNWTYRLALTAESRWSDFGAEQRAMLAQRLWSDGLPTMPETDLVRRLVPWA